MTSSIQNCHTIITKSTQEIQPHNNNNNSNKLLLFFVGFFLFAEVFEENVLSLEAWLKENRLMAYKEAFEVEVDDLNDFSCEILKDNEQIMEFITKDLGVSKILKQRKILNAIIKLQGMYVGLQILFFVLAEIVFCLVFLAKLSDGFDDKKEMNLNGGQVVNAVQMEHKENVCDKEFYCLQSVFFVHFYNFATCVFFCFFFLFVLFPAS